MDITLTLAQAADLNQVLSMARALDLDCSEAHAEEFTVARRGSGIIGFGRLKRSKDFLELSTLGVVGAEQGKGTGTKVMRELLARAEEDLYLVTVIPDFFSRFGFKKVKDFPEELVKKCEFCHSFGFKEGEVFAMKRIFV